MTPASRFWAHVDRSAGPDGCWPWQAHRSRHGYGATSFHGRSHQAHRLAYELAVGPIPDGLTIDHLCRNKPCCNPRHLEPVTSRENTRRDAAVRLGWVPDRVKTSATLKAYCRNGHPFTPDNSYIWPSGRRRRCLTCHSIEHRRARAIRSGRLAVAA